MIRGFYDVFAGLCVHLQTLQKGLPGLDRPAGQEH
jgi:hypothetical protein